MVVRTRFRSALMLLAFHAVVIGSSGFFAWHAYTGERGLVARREHKIKIAQLNRHLEELKIEKTGHERRVTELAFDQLDKDLLDERARVVLNLAHRNDLVILTGKK